MKVTNLLFLPLFILLFSFYSVRPSLAFTQISTSSDSITINDIDSPSLFCASGTASPPFAWDFATIQVNGVPTEYGFSAGETMPFTAPISLTNGDTVDILFTLGEDTCYSASVTYPNASPILASSLSIWLSWIPDAVIAFLRANVGVALAGVASFALVFWIIAKFRSIVHI